MKSESYLEIVQNTQLSTAPMGLLTD